MIGRFATAAVALPMLVLVVWAGGPIFDVMVAVSAALGAVEVCRMAGSRGPAPSQITAAALSALLVLSHHSFSFIRLMPEYVPLVIVTAGVAFLALILTFSERLRLRGEGLTLWAAIYPGALLAHAPLLRGTEQGLEWVTLLLVVTFSTDTAAYFFGRVAGKRLLAPAVSPNKTWEGAIAGFLAAVLAAVAAALVLNVDAGLPAIVILGVLAGAAGQGGDLFASKLKRLAGFKESGRLLPGHGGILDRLDSIVFNLVLVYYFVIWGVQ